jgi:hypothetical protein
MARSIILPGFPDPIFVNETSEKELILPGVYINETSVIDVSVIETCSAADLVSAGIIFPVSVSETASPVDASSAVVEIGAIIVEAANATDLLPTITDYFLTVSDTLHAQDWIGAAAAGGGGGGSGGLFGVGEDGERGRFDGIGGYGGAADNSLTPRQLISESTGNTGIEYDGTYGSGSGGSGGDWGILGVGGDGGTGGLYGGGGGGGGAGLAGGGQGALGGEGFIYLQYDPGTGPVVIILDKDSVSPFTFPSDWSTTNNIVLLIGAGGCGADGSQFVGGDGGGGGSTIGAINTALFNPNDVFDFVVPTAANVCAGIPGNTVFGDIEAAPGINGDGSGGGVSVPFPGTSGGGTVIIDFTPGDGGPGGDLGSLVVITVTIHETATATDAVDTLLRLLAKKPPPRPPILSTNVPSATGQQPYPPVPTNMDNALAWNTQIARTLNLVLSGKMNNTLATFTLTPNSTTTTLYMTQIGANSVIQLTPLTPAATEEQWHVSERKQGQATIVHSNSPATDRTYRVIVVA